MAKLFTAQEYCAWLEGLAREFIVYWPFTAVEKCTDALLEKKRYLYQHFYRKPETIEECEKDIANGQICSCDIGLIKGAVWTDLGEHECRYNWHELYDLDHYGLYNVCRVRGPYGPIETMPEQPGLMVAADRHVGVYIGNGHTIDMRLGPIGICTSRLCDRRWKMWYTLPWVEYGVLTDEPAHRECSRITTLGTRLLEFGMRGDDVRQLKIAIRLLGVKTYGDLAVFDKKVLAVVKNFQMEHGLPIDGEYDYFTHHAMMREIGYETEESGYELNDEIRTPVDGVIRVGSAVRITGEKYYNGMDVPEWIRKKNWLVHSVDGDKIVLGRSEDGGTLIMCPVKRDDLILAHMKEA